MGLATALMRDPTTTYQEEPEATTRRIGLFENLGARHKFYSWWTIESALSLFEPGQDLDIDTIVRKYVESRPQTPVDTQLASSQRQAETTSRKSPKYADYVLEADEEWIDQLTRTFEKLYLARLKAAFMTNSIAQPSPDSVIAAIEEVNWNIMPPDAFVWVIEKAVSFDFVNIARKLADSGHRMHPLDERLDAFMRGLAPSKIVESRRPAQRHLSASMEWLRLNSQNYRGQWIAVKNGDLLGVESSRSALLDAIGNEQTESLITRIP